MFNRAQTNKYQKRLDLKISNFTNLFSLVIFVSHFSEELYASLFIPVINERQGKYLRQLKD